MNIIIPVRPIDGNNLKSLTAAILQMGPIYGHRIIIVFTQVMTEEVEKASAALKAVTNDVIPLLQMVEPFGGPAEALNKYFQHFLLWSEEKLDEPCMWINPGSVPISTDWATAIQDEYEISFKRFLGSRMKTSDGEEIVGSPMVFNPKVLRETVPDWPYLGEVEWEVQWRYPIKRFGTHAVSISMSPDDKTKFKANLTNNETPFSLPPRYISPPDARAIHDMRLTEFNDIVRSSHAKLRLSDVADRMNVPRDEVRDLADKSNIEINKGGWLAIA